MSRIIVKLKRPERRKIQRFSRKTKDPQARIRALIVLRYSENMGCQRISQVLDCAPSTAVSTIRRYLKDGIFGLSDQRRYNGSPKVTPKYVKFLRRIVQLSPLDFGWNRPTWTRELLSKVMAQLLDITLSRTTLSRELKRIGVRWNQGRPTLRCPWSKAKQRRVLGEIKSLIENLPEDEVAYYQDEVDIHLNPKIGRDWTLKGRQRQILTPGRNQKRYVAGALCTHTNRLFWVWGERKNSELFMSLVDWLVDLNPDKKRIHLILDNYIIHKSKKTMKHIASLDKEIVLHFLPPYSPTENKIERKWQDLHANVTRNHSRKTIEELLHDVDRYLTYGVFYQKRTMSPKALKVLGLT